MTNKKEEKQGCVALVVSISVITCVVISLLIWATISETQITNAPTYMLERELQKRYLEEARKEQAATRVHLLRIKTNVEFKSGIEGKKK